MAGPKLPPPKPPAPKPNTGGNKPGVDINVGGGSSGDGGEEQKSYLKQLREEAAKGFKKGFYESFGLTPPEEKKEIDKIKEKMGDKSDSKQNEDIEKILKEKGNATKIDRKVDALGIYTRRNYQEIVDLKRRVSGIENSLMNLKKSDDATSIDSKTKKSSAMPSASGNDSSILNDILNSAAGQAAYEAAKRLGPAALSFIKRNPWVLAASSFAYLAYETGKARRENPEKAEEFDRKLKTGGARSQVIQGPEAERERFKDQPLPERKLSPTELLKKLGVSKDDVESLKGNIITLKDGRRIDTTKQDFITNDDQSSSPSSSTSSTSRSTSSSGRTWMATAETLLQRDRNWDSFAYNQDDLRAAAQQLTERKVATTSQLSVDTNRLESLARKIAQERKTKSSNLPTERFDTGADYREAESTPSSSSAEKTWEQYLKESNNDPVLATQKRDMDRKIKSNQAAGATVAPNSSASGQSSRTWSSMVANELTIPRNWSSFNYTQDDLRAAAQQLTDRGIQTSSQASLDKSRLESLARDIARKREGATEDASPVITERQQSASPAAVQSATPEMIAKQEDAKKLSREEVYVRTDDKIEFESNDKIVLNTKTNMELKAPNGVLKIDTQLIEFVQQGYVLDSKGLRKVEEAGSASPSATPAGAPPSVTPGGGTGGGATPGGGATGGATPSGGPSSTTPGGGRQAAAPTPQMSTEARAAFDALKAGTLSADDPKAKVLQGLSDQQLQSMGVQKTEGGFSMASSQAAGKIAAMSDEQIAQSLQRSGKLKSGNFEQQSPMLMNRLMKDLNLTREQAAGVIGNLGHESAGLQAGIQEKRPISGRGGLGWAQWTGPRRRDFEAYLKRTGQSATDPEANYGFLVEELKGKEKGALAKLRTAQTVDQATHIFERAYERAGIKHDASRQQFAQKANRLFNPEAGTGEASNEPVTPESIAKERQRLTQQEQQRESAGREAAWAKNAPAAAGTAMASSGPAAAAPPSPSTPAAGLSSSGISGRAAAAMPSLKRDLAPLSQERSVGGYEAMYQQIGTFRGPGRYGNLNISAGERAAGRYGGLCGVGVSNAVGVMFGDSRFKSVSGMHAGSFSMAGNNKTLTDSGLYQGKQALSDKDFNALKTNPKGLPPGTIVAVGSTNGRQHIQMWDGKNWISDTVQKGLLNMRPGEHGTGAIYYPTAEGLARLPKEVRAQAEANGFKFGDIPPSGRTTTDNQAAVQQGATAPTGEGARPIDKQPPVERQNILKQIREGLPEGASPEAKAARERLLQAEQSLRAIDPSNKLLPENLGKSDAAKLSPEAASAAIQNAEQQFRADAAKANVGEGGPAFGAIGDGGALAPSGPQGPNLSERIADARAGLEDTTSKGTMPDMLLEPGMRSLTTSVDAEGKATSEFADYAGSKKTLFGSTFLGSLLTREGGVSEQFMGSKTRTSDEGTTSSDIFGRRVSGGLLGVDQRQLYLGNEKLNVSSGQYAQVQSLLKEGKMDEAKAMMEQIKVEQMNAGQGGPGFDDMSFIGAPMATPEAASPVGMDLNSPEMQQAMDAVKSMPNENYDTGAGGFADVPLTGTLPPQAAPGMTAAQLADISNPANAYLDTSAPKSGFSPATQAAAEAARRASEQAPSGPKQFNVKTGQWEALPQATQAAAPTAATPSPAGMPAVDIMGNATGMGELPTQPADVGEPGYSGKSGEMMQTEVEKVRLQEDIKRKSEAVEKAQEENVRLATEGRGGTGASGRPSPESAPPSPGNDGYGDQKNSSDMPSICTV